MHLFRLHLLIWLPVFLVLPGCRKNRLDRANDIAVIDVISRLGKYEAIPVSRFVTELEYIPLEIRNDCLIGEARFIVVTPKHLFVAGTNYCYAFDRAGRFVGKIGSIGQGPGEYQSITGLSMDEKRQSLYLSTSRSILEYSWDGVFRQSTPIPKNMIEFPLDNVSYVRDTLFIGHIPNFSGNEIHNFLLFDKSGQVVKSFDNHIQLDRAKPWYFFASDCSMRFFSISESVYVKENANDTLYCLNEQNELIPYFVFDLGKYVFSKEKREYEGGTPPVSVTESMRGIIEVPDYFKPMVGVPNFIFFSLMTRGLPQNIPFPEKREIYFVPPPGFQRIDTYESRSVSGIYNMDNQKTQLLDTDPVSRMQGLINDIDGSLSFWPKYYTSDNELVDIWQAYDMKEILTEEYFAAHEIKNPQAHQKLRELLKNLRDDDNPVIVIARLK